MPETVVRRALTTLTRQMHAVAVANAAMAAAATAGLVRVMSGSSLAAAVAGVLVGAPIAWRGWRRWTRARAAGVLDRTPPGSDNLLVTAAEVLEGRAIHPILARELFAQAAERLAALDDGPQRRALSMRLALATGLVASAALLLWSAPPRVSLSRTASRTTADDAPVGGAEAALRVTITPPAYARRIATTLDNPVRVVALEGSTVRLQMSGVTDRVELVEPGHEPQRFDTVDGSASYELTAAQSGVFLIRRPAAAGPSERLLQLQVERDQRPIVSIERPGRDLLFATPSGTVPVVISARDDLEVLSVALRYTKISGSGEAFSFAEGEIPLPLAAAADGTVQGQASLVLDRLALEDGDALVYRAFARDRNPGADPSTSESFLIEIGRRGEASSAGFALPEDRDRQALSQQMLIIKTERLHAQRSSLSPQVFLEQSQLLAVEQRMVRAEFVFMTGGEVVDEVEEAAHAHDLEQGRFENEGQIELLNATREMSRAEARLNAADTAEALAFERAALAALQRAFDRRRYFLRTLPERTRIDTTRRLSGDASTARPRAADRPRQAADPLVEQLRRVLRELTAAERGQERLDASLAARVVGIDPEAEASQQLAVVVSSGADMEAQRRAAAEAQAHLRDLLRRRLAAAAADRVRPDPLLGALASEQPRAGGSR